MARKGADAAMLPCANKGNIDLINDNVSKGKDISDDEEGRLEK